MSGTAEREQGVGVAARKRGIQLAARLALKREQGVRVGARRTGAKGAAREVLELDQRVRVAIRGAGLDPLSSLTDFNASLTADARGFLIAPIYTRWRIFPYYRGGRNQ